MIPPIFAGQPVFVVAGGPSLKSLDWSRLAGKNAIAINRAYENLPDATMLWFADARFWRMHRDRLVAHAARWKATTTLNYHPDDNLPPDIFQYRPTGHDGFDPEPGRIRTGNNSAFMATHLAAQMGAKAIIMLGVDMKHGAGGETHYHDGHGFQHREETLTDLMLPFFRSLAKPLAERGISVINASLGSALTVWPRCSIAEGLARYDEISAALHSAHR